MSNEKMNRSETRVKMMYQLLNLPFPDKIYAEGYTSLDLLITLDEKKIIGLRYIGPAKIKQFQIVIKRLKLIKKQYNLKSLEELF